MPTKKHTQIHLNFKLDSWKQKVSGLTIADSDTWTLLINNPADYVCDGFLLIKGSAIVARTYKMNDEWIEEVLRLKVKKIKKPRLNLSSTAAMLRSLKQQGYLVGVWSADKKNFWLGRILKITKDRFTIKQLSTRANWIENKTFLFKNITMIEFGSDYIETLAMMTKK